MKKSGIILAVFCVVAGLLLVGVLVLGMSGNKSVRIGEVDYDLSLTYLDLSGQPMPEVEILQKFTDLRSLDIRDSGMTSKDYVNLKEALPLCDIRWSIPFGDGYVDSESQSIRISAIEDGDVEQLQYLTCLRTIDAEDCRDYGALLTIQKQYPDLEVNYHVHVQDQVLDRSVESLNLGTISAQELEALLPHFENLRQIDLTGEQHDDDALFALMAANPDLQISWDLEICGLTVNSLAEEVDVSGISIDDLSAFESSVLRLPNLKKVVMCDCGIGDEEMDALNRRHEDVEFVWSVLVGIATVRTDVTYFMPYQYGMKLNNKMAENLRYLTNLECIDMGHMYVTNCEFLRYMPKLKYLILGDTDISDLSPLAGLSELVYLEVFMTKVTDYTPLLELKNLQCLNISYTYGQADVICQMNWVPYIRWIASGGCPHSEETRQKLTEALPNTTLELYTGASATGGQWRKTQHYYDMRDLLGMDYMTG